MNATDESGFGMLVEGVPRNQLHDAGADDQVRILTSRARRAGRAVYQQPGLVVVLTYNRHTGEYDWRLNGERSSEYDFRRTVKATRTR